MITKTPGAMCVFWNVFGQGVRLLPVNNHALAHMHTDTAFIPLSPPKNAGIGYIINLKFIIQSVILADEKNTLVKRHAHTRIHS